MEDGADEVGAAEPLQLERRDWQKVQRHLLTDGYREGRSDGEEASLQQHFDAGYKSGLERVWLVAQLRGRLCAAIAVCHLSGDGSELPVLAGDHVSRLTELEQRLGAKRGCDAADRAEIVRELAAAEDVLSRLVSEPGQERDVTEEGAAGSQG